MRTTLMLAALAGALGVSAVITSDDLWFFADFDSMPQLDGAAFDKPLSNAPEVKGRFGKGRAFLSDEKRCENRFWVVRDRELVKNFPAERGSFSCWYRTPDSVTNRIARAPVFGLTGFWQYQWQWTGSGFRTSEARNGYIPLKGFARTNEWHHFAATWCPEKAAFYIDGLPIAEREKPKLDLMPDIKGAVLRIGTGGDGSEAANLELDEIAIFRLTLAADEVKALATATKGLLEGRPQLLAAPILLPFYWRNDEASAIRQRIFSETDMTVEVSAEIGGKKLEPFAFTVRKGENKLDVPFRASRYRAGEYPWEVTLRRGTETVLQRGGTLKIFPRLDRDEFKFMNWGGWRELPHDFLHMVGINSRNVNVGDTAGMRRFAGDGAFFPNAMYGNSWLWSRQDIDAQAIQERTKRDFAYLEGLHPWTTTLVNTEVYGTRHPQTATNHPNFHAWAEKELGFKPDYRYGTAPNAVFAKSCEGGLLPTGIVQRGECKSLDTLVWICEKGMFPYLIDTETRTAIREIDPRNVVWSEPAAEGVAERLDMSANWHYQYRTSSTLRELYHYSSCARSYGKPYMPTLSGEYCHGYCIPRWRDAKDKRSRPGVQSDDEVAIKAWLSIAAVPAHALSIFMLDAWLTGREKGWAAPDTGDRFGKEWHARIQPAATLLRDLPNERAPLAYVLPSECDFTIGMGWNETHYRDHLADAMAEYGLPFDCICNRELEAGKLREYKAALFIMGRAIYADHAKRLDEADRAGVRIHSDRYCWRDFKNGVRHTDLYYNHYKQDRIFADFRAWYAKLADELREHLTAKSDGDGTDAYTFTKKYDGVTYVTVVNNKRSEQPGFLNNLITNAWYRPYAAANTITTHIKLPAGSVVYEFNADAAGARRPRPEVVTAQGAGPSRPRSFWFDLSRSYAPMEGKVFCVYPTELAKLRLDVKDGFVRIALDDVNGKPAPGRQVVDVEVRDPDGNLHDETGRYVMEGGRVKIPLRLADDDVRGSAGKCWQVTAKELTTGFACTCRW